MKVNLNQRKGYCTRLILSLGLIWFSGTPAVLSEPVTAGNSEGVSLTVYNGNFGVVKDIRSVDLQSGVNYLRFEDVAAKIDPTSVSFLSLTAPNSVIVREQNYQYDLLNPSTILEKSVGKHVRFRQFLPTGQVNEVSGILLNAPQVTVSDSGGNATTQSQGLVVKTEDGILLNPEGEAKLAELPAGLVSKPSLLWKLEATKPGRHKSEITYQTSDLNWHCDYVVIVDANDNTVDITSWVTLDNKSGASYKNASLKLLAGDVHRITAPLPCAAPMVGDAMAAPAQQFKEQAFAEYHLYRLEGTTDVNNNETKQLSLFSANNVSAGKQFVFEPEQSRFGGEYIPPPNDTGKIHVKLEIANTAANQLGLPMPAGKMRVYKRDKEGSLQFVGEDTIDHTASDEKIRIFLGDAFDLVGERKQTSLQRLSDRTQRASYELSLRNHKDCAVTITAVEHAYGFWKILSSSEPYTKKDSHTFEFAVKVPAKGEAKVTYDLETKW